MAGPIDFQAIISENSAARNAIVAAVTGKRIVVTNIVLVCTADNTVVWESATTALSGVMTFNAAGGYSMSGGALLKTVAGEALNITQTVAALVTGHITYRLE